MRDRPLLLPFELEAAARNEKEVRVRPVVANVQRSIWNSSVNAARRAGAAPGEAIPAIRTAAAAIVGARMV